MTSLSNGMHIHNMRYRLYGHKLFVNWVQGIWIAIVDINEGRVALYLIPQDGDRPGKDDH